MNIKTELINKLQKCGFKKPSNIQEIVCKISRKQNVLSQSQNGSGKTLSFLVPILNDLEYGKSNAIGDVIAPQFIILADTRALIMQIKGIINLIDSKVKVGFLYSGHYNLEPCDILILTVEQLKKAYQKKDINFNNLKRFIIDEFDKTLEPDSSRSFIPQFILKVLNNKVLFIFTSATIPDYTKLIIDKLSSKINFINIEIKKEELTLKNVNQMFIHLLKSDESNKYYCIEKILKKVNFFDSGA